MALSFDPETLPVVRTGEDLPKVRVGELQVDALRRRFETPPVWSPEIRSEARIGERSPAHASVLIALVPRDGELTVLLTRRTEHLSAHPGQISFPGGRVEPEDADAAATALREAAEETGLDGRFVDVLGTMPTYATGTGFIVTPVVAVLRPGFTVQADPGEVAEVFEVPLSFLMNPSHHRSHRVEVAGVAREFLSIPWQTNDARGVSTNYFIWGATAAMLRNLYRFLTA